MLSYLLGNPGALGLDLSRPLAASLLLLVALFFLRPHPGGRGVAWLRSASFAAVVAALAGLRVTATLPARERSVVIAVDASDSVGADGIAWANKMVAQVRRTSAPGDTIDVLTFAADAELQSQQQAPLDASTHHGSTASTRLANAIDESLALFAPERDRVLLLLTDGNETDGDGRARIPGLRAADVTVYAAAPPPQPDNGVRVQSLIAPPTTASGRIVPVRLVAENRGKARAAVLRLYLDDEIIDSSALQLGAGINSFDLATRIDGAGGHRLRAEITAEGDNTPANNSAEVAITLQGPLHVLLITPRRHSGTAATLRRQGFAVDTQAPGAALGELLTADAYHAVVLEDARAAQLDAAALSQIEEFVRVAGGGLVVTGGAATFGDEGFRGTALERLLPVSIEPRRPKPGTREPLALFLVIDRSNSMGYNSRIGTLRDGEKLRYAKTAALEVIHQLKDQDLLGVIAFDSRPSEIAPLRSLRQNRHRLERLIPRLVENGGTDFYEALLSARDQLSRTRVAKRHIILLTDGDTNRAGQGEYAALTREMAAARISVTTIRIGDNKVNLKLLQSISRGTGGTFHHVADVRTLPDLMLREATRGIAPQEKQGEQFFPALGSHHQLLRGLDESLIPPLSDYAYSKPKGGAEVLLQVTRLERRDPLLSVWNYGLGRVAAFTASPSEGAESWLAWSQVAQFWSQLVQWSARQHAAADLACRVDRHDGSLELVVRAFDTGADEAQLSARLHLGDEETLSLALNADEPRVFRAPLPALRPGHYGLTLLRRTPGGQALEIDQTVYVPPREDPNAEHRRATPNLDLLRDLTAATGGVLDPKSRDFTHRALGTRRAAYPLDNFLVPLAMLLFLAEIALRRLRALREQPEG
jgi:Mg-chelatase subunit ChlD